MIAMHNTLPETLQKYITHVKQNPKTHNIEIKQLITRIETTYQETLKENSIIIFDDKEPKRIIKFCESLCINLKGDKLILFDWQKFLIFTLFGFKQKLENDEKILFNNAFLLIAKKNGKSSLASALLLYYIVTKPNSINILVACDYNQTKINFNYILDFIKFTPKLKKAWVDDVLYVKESPPQTIVSREMYSKLLIIPETRKAAAQGQKPTFVIFDEIASYKTSDIINKIQTGMVDNNAISFALTTGETNTQNPGLLELERAKSVLSGKFKSTNYLPFIYKLDDRDEWTDEKNYCKANPSLNKKGLISGTKLNEELQKALQSPINQPSFKAYHLNLFVANAIMGIRDEYWNKCISNATDYKQYITDEKLINYPCYGAIDLSKVDDLTAYSLYFYIPEIRKYYAKHKFYIPKGTLDLRLKTESEQYYLWTKDKQITLCIKDGTDNLTMNYEYLKQDILDDIAKYKVEGIAYDVYHATKFIEELEAINSKVIYSPFSMTWKNIAPANKAWYSAILDGEIIDANPVMNYNRSNAKFEIDRNNNIIFVKKSYVQSTERIDGIDTSVMAHAMLSSIINKEKFDPKAYQSKLESIEY